jgi:hypothetical protein
MDELILDFINLVGLDASALDVVKLVGGVALGSFFVFAVWYDWRNDRRKAREHEALWTVLAAQLGLRLQGKVIKGEYEGVPVRIAEESHGADGKGALFYVVRALVPGGLPSQFVAAPHRWTDRMDRLLARGSFKAGDAALDEYFVFQSEQPDEGKRFVEQAEALRGLLQLSQSEGIGFGEKGEVGIAQTSFLGSVAETRSRLEAVTRMARALAETQAQLTRTAPDQHHAKG